MALRSSTRLKPESDKTMKPKPEYVDGPEATARFDALVRRVLSVSSEEIKRREAEYKRQSALNPNRRGPKPKVKPSASARKVR
jgi:hypothetical protein